MTAQASLDAQLETGNSPFADFTQFPESNSNVSEARLREYFELINTCYCLIFN